jgi:hypothetical protein
MPGWYFRRGASRSCGRDLAAQDHCERQVIAGDQPLILGGLRKPRLFAIDGGANRPIGSGIPVGYQAIAASGRDKTAIAFSRFIEREIGGFVRILPSGILFDFITLTNTVHEIEPIRLATVLVSCVGRLTSMGSLFIYSYPRSPHALFGVRFTAEAAQ